MGTTETPTPRRLAVLGAGSWGTALAMQSARLGVSTRLWGRDREQMVRMAADRENARYLPGIELPTALDPRADFDKTLEGADLVLIAVPSHAFGETARALAASSAAKLPMVWASKGFEPGSGRLLHEVFADVLGTTPAAVLSGPSFANEVARNLPTAVTIASRSEAHANTVAGYFHGQAFRAYTSTDIVGVELGGAIKNVLAVATGIADGMQLGANARAALMTRGLAEMARLAASMGARPETLMGLSGVGDLVLTCTGDLSRNRRFGLKLGAGMDVDEALSEIGQTVEGFKTAEEVARLADRYQVDMPISQVVFKILSNELSFREGLQVLLSREQRPED